MIARKSNGFRALPSTRRRVKNNVLLCGSSVKATFAKALLEKLDTTFKDIEDYYFPNRRPEDAYTAPQSREDVSADLHFIRLQTWVDQFHFAVMRSRTISLYTSRVRFHPFNQGKYSYRLKRANAPDVKSVINRSLFKAGLVV